MDKQGLIELFRKERGLANFGVNECWHIRISEPLPPVSIRARFEPVVAAEPFVVSHQFDLRHATLGNETWAYVVSGDHLIVEPFKWLGHEFLSGHVW